MPDISLPHLEACAALIAAAGRELCARGWTPATSSNFSMRLDTKHAAVTASGRHKGQLQRADILAVALDTGRVVHGSGNASAETALHTQIYAAFPAAHAILHTHSRAQSVASRLFADAGRLRLQGWELQKAIAGIDSHESTLDLPVFANAQHMPDLTRQVDAWLAAGRSLHAYLIAGHGLYAWGRDMTEAMRHVEALEFLLQCELDLRKLSS